MTRYELIDGQEAFLSDAAIIGFVPAMNGFTNIITVEGRVAVKGFARDLHEAWWNREMQAKETASTLEATQRKG